MLGNSFKKKAFNVTKSSASDEATSRRTLQDGLVEPVLRDMRFFATLRMTGGEGLVMTV
jgi:hypothetical protein